MQVERGMRNMRSHLLMAAKTKKYYFLGTTIDKLYFSRITSIIVKATPR